MSLLSDEDSLEGRSWVELCDAERAREESLLQAEHDEDECVSEAHTNGSASEAECTPLAVNQSLEEGEIRDRTLEESELRNDSILEVVVHRTPKKSDNDQFRAPKSVTKSLSYARILQGKATTDIPAHLFKSESIANDDLSLTGHLDVFHVVSPCKTVSKDDTEIQLMIDEDTVMFSPQKKEENPVKNMKRPFMLIESPAPKTTSQLSSSVSNIRKIAKSVADSDVHSTAADGQEDDSSACGDDGVSNMSSPSAKRELEVNPDVLHRRQKQIDYGKNTLGYETYVKQIPKHSRTKDQPKTPPKHLKLSRRAWDGLIKNWRLKLHQWDPASEGGHQHDLEYENINFDQYSSYSSEDRSSYDSCSVRSDSVSSTPKQPRSVTEGDDGGELWTRRNGDSKTDSSKELWSDCPQKTKKSDEDDEYLGCEPLTENCVKACS